MKNIALHGRKINEASRQHVLDLLQILKERAILHLSEKFIQENPGLPLGNEVFKRKVPQQCEAVMSVGGDGTILETMTYVLDGEIPILGINTGRLGFLATIARDQIREAIDLFFDGKYSLEKRSLLELKTKSNLFGNQPYALNEFSILRRETVSMISVKAFIDDQYINTYWADGLMVATPTGSTGYSLSCGGPILLPQNENFIITPVSPHNLNIRPLIVPDDAELTFKVESRNANYLVSMDSRSTRVEGDAELRVSKAPFYIFLVKIEGYSFIDTLKSKLSWGLDKRN